MIQNAKIVAENQPQEVYFAENALRGAKEFIMSASALRNFAQCPHRWLLGYNPPETEAKEYGSLLDCRFLTPDLFKLRYAIKPSTYRNENGEVKPWNGNSNVCKAWLEDHADFEITSAADVQCVDEAIKRLMADEIIEGLVSNSKKQVHVTAEWHDPETGLIVPLKSLIDIIPDPDLPFHNWLFDVKTSRNASITAWQRWCYQAGYFLQAAMYLDMYVAATDEDRNSFGFILSENFPPYETGKRLLSQDFTDLGRATYKQMLANYCQCLKHNRWPTYDETDESDSLGFTLVHPEPFMAERAAFAPRFNFDEDEAESPVEDRYEDVIP